jgi:hypothetical protein
MVLFLVPVCAKGPTQESTLVIWKHGHIQYRVFIVVHVFVVFIVVHVFVVLTVIVSFALDLVLVL